MSRHLSRRETLPSSTLNFPGLKYPQNKNCTKKASLHFEKRDREVGHEPRSYQQPLMCARKEAIASSAAQCRRSRHGSCPCPDPN